MEIGVGHMNQVGGSPLPLRVKRLAALRESSASVARRPRRSSLKVRAGLTVTAKLFHLATQQRHVASNLPGHSLFDSTV